MRQQRRFRFVRERQCWTPLLPTEHREVMVGQKRYVLPTISKGWECQGDHVQTIEKILSKAPAAHFVFEHAIGGRQHAHVGLALARFSKTLVRAIVEKTQKPALSIGREFANFVEEERAAFGLLDFAGDVGDRSCKRAPSMSK